MEMNTNFSPDKIRKQQLNYSILNEKSLKLFFISLKENKNKQKKRAEDNFENTKKDFSWVAYKHNLLFWFLLVYKRSSYIKAFF